MTKDEFFKKIKDVIQAKIELTADTNLLDLEEWDSLSKVLTTAFLDKEFGIKVTNKEVQDFDTIRDIMIKAGVQND